MHHWCISNASCVIGSWVHAFFSCVDDAPLVHWRCMDKPAMTHDALLMHALPLHEKNSTCWIRFHAAAMHASPLHDMTHDASPMHEWNHWCMKEMHEYDTRCIFSCIAAAWKCWIFLKCMHRRCIVCTDSLYLYCLKFMHLCMHCWCTIDASAMHRVFYP